VNLGCIDLNQWYARSDDVDRPDYVHFDLDPGEQAPFEQVLETALVVHETLESLEMPSYAKTTGSRGVHVYVPIVRQPTQKQVWTFAKTLAIELAARHPTLMTSVYSRVRRPSDRVLVDYNQNAWGRTLASVYSVRPHPQACVPTPVTWREVRRGVPGILPGERPAVVAAGHDGGEPARAARLRRVSGRARAARASRGTRRGPPWRPRS